MMFTKDNRCACLTGYKYIDENDPRKGCRLGSNRAEQDAFIESVNSLQAKWDSMNTKAKQCETAAENVASATEENSAKTFLDQATQYGSSAMSLVSEVQGMYNNVKTEYNGLEKEDKTAVNRHKQSADTMKADADKVQSKVQGLISKANSDYMKLIERKNNPNTGALCVQTHGTPNGNQCSCDPKKNLEPSADKKSCVCKKVGKNRYEWHEKCGMCRHQNAVDNDLACGA